MSSTAATAAAPSPPPGVEIRLLQIDKLSSTMFLGTRLARTHPLTMWRGPLHVPLGTLE